MQPLFDLRSYPHTMHSPCPCPASQLLEMLAAGSSAEEARTPQPGSFRQRRRGISRTGSEAHFLWLQPALLADTQPWASHETSKPHFFTFNTWEMLFQLGVMVRVKIWEDLQVPGPSGRAWGVRVGLACVRLSEASRSVLLRVYPHVLRDKTGGVRQAWRWSGQE